jgi:hypothetical protein
MIYRITRFLLAIATPEVTIFELTLMFLGWLLRRGPPNSRFYREFGFSPQTLYLLIVIIVVDGHINYELNRFFRLVLAVIRKHGKRLAMQVVDYR